MSFTVQGSGVNVNAAESTRRADAEASIATGNAAGRDGNRLVRTDAALAAVVGVGASPAGDAGATGPRIELTRPKPSAHPRETDRSTVAGMEREHKRFAASQTPVVTGVHDALVQRHVSRVQAGRGDAARAIEPGVDGHASRAPAERPPGFSFADDAAFSAMLAFGSALQKNVQSDLVMQGKLTTLAHDAMMSAAQQDRSIGNAQMTAAISGGALQATTSLGGAFQQMKGLNTKSMSIENELKPQAELKQFHASQSLELRGMSEPVLPKAEASPVKIKRDTGETVRHDIDAGEASLRGAHEDVLSLEAPARQNRIDMHGLRHEQSLVKAGRQQMKGELIQSGGLVGKNQIDGASAQQQGAERAEQKEDESAQQTAMAAASARDEAAHRGREAAQKALDAAKSQVANDNAVAAQVANGLRA
ncbi:IpaC/SipC family type III secretion system effector [Burkholderia alba]|uniref:IpaC/SipC family type III secretion system effector n=1 Tax=Burkholderia alba TaxID=2683677 RepID=UPI002B0546D3|nr:IpaC/SipC family type III secretion system effector [Burkholderia alba]